MKSGSKEIIVILLFSIFMTVSTSVQAKTTIEELPAGFQFHNAETSKDISKRLRERMRGAMAWPTQQQFENLKYPELGSARAFTVDFIARVIQKEWMPSDIEQRLIGLNNYLDGQDVFLTRYKREGHAIQIVSTLSTIHLSVRRIDSARLESKSQQEALGLQTLRAFLNKNEQIEDEVHETVNYENSVYTNFDFRTHHPTVWWGKVAWWTDGQTTLFLIRRGGKRVYLGTDNEAWFENQ